MRRSRIVLLTLLAVVLLPVVVFFLMAQFGPRAAAPIADPRAVIRQARGNSAEQTARKYTDAGAMLESAAPQGWADSSSRARLGPIPEALATWIDEQGDALALIREASTEPGCLFADSGYPTLDTPPSSPGVRSIRTVCRFLSLRGWLAAQRHDLETLADSAELANRVGRHAITQPAIVGRLLGDGCLSTLHGDPFMLDPLAWSDLGAEQRRAYLQRITPLFEPLPPIAAAVVEEQDFSCWMIQATPEVQRLSLLAPIDRVCGEVVRRFKPLHALAALPIEERARPDHPVRSEVAAVSGAKASWLNPADIVAGLMTPSLLRAIDLDLRLEAMLRGNHTVAALFSKQLQDGAFSPSLAGLGEFSIDPYSGKSFVYETTAEGFRLYSVGLDGDDDGGLHSERFGETRNKWGETTGPPNGDYVFWPPPKEPEK